MRIKLTLRYRGDAYAGWQRQKNAPAVQNVLEEILRGIYREEILTVGSGRTDAGVHADEQVAVLEAPERSFEPGKLALILNLQLPEDIRVVRTELCPADFHPRYDAMVRHYRYRLLDKRHSDAHSTLWNARAWDPGAPLDPEDLALRLSPLRGSHDFTTFCSPNDPSPNKIRELFDIRVWRDRECLLVDLWGSAFLQNMVRSIVGNLVHAVKRRKPADVLGKLLLLKDPHQAKLRAPPQGLTLQRVFYTPVFGDRPYYHRPKTWMREGQAAEETPLEEETSP